MGELFIVFGIALIITLLIEFPFYWFRGYRDKPFIWGFVLINIVTNLLLNGVMGFFVGSANLHVPVPTFLNTLTPEDAALLASLEVIAFLVEYLVLSQLAKRGKKLFFTVLYANLASLVMGTLLMTLLVAIIF